MMTMSAQTISETLNTLTILTAGLAMAALGLFAVFYVRQGAGRRRYTTMLLWLLLLTAWFTTNAGLRIFTGYRSPSVAMSLARVVVDLQGFIGILVIFGLRLRARK